MKLKAELIKLKEGQRLHQCDVPIIAITGGIACGKSTVSDYLSSLGHFVINADQLVKEIYQTTEAVNFIKATCPNAISEGSIDFKKLRQEVFNSPELKNKIEQFIYQRLPQAFYIKKQAMKPDQQVIFYDVPLLFEKGLDSQVDLHWCVYVSEQTQIERLVIRDSISEADAKKIIAQQMPIEEKKKRAHRVIDNSKSKEQTFQQLESLLGELI
ncbi:MAG: dephospho-CoA kinase [Bdellovibrio sp. CG12_big_fil_rev_8_21_14_0_65_39_13]|nr:MAG: dephospho-CoA kinase [Bdellovibrio sp. CG22_combo_CG10-13_8_21_14_all_39_27]PIQ58502.1 MAG: dephospho-CoA kinase [Bdellovibrio sp. CG12_big_fil_rev_8_21_14_0_65_39_13]PIR35454.1 MAG: dephospho-CoA kinase [Bdellovibrio sp. CG11_big_fil_rev_8_21_14_0_20_39_38]